MNQGNPQDIKKMIIDSEAAFGLNPGTLCMKTDSGLDRPKGVYDDIKLSDIRKAICYRIKSIYPGLPLRTLATVVGVRNHSSAYQAIVKAKDYIEAKDEEFLFYLNRISDIIK